MKRYTNSILKKGKLVFFILLSFFLSNNLLAQTWTIGSGTGSNNSDTYPAPFGNYYKGARHQIIYRASELISAGMSAGEINQLGFNVTALNACDTLTGMEIKIGHTSTNAFGSSYLTGLTTVYGQENYQPVQGWNMFTMSTPFNWNGTQNIVVEICFNDYPGDFSENASTQWTSAGFNAVRYRRSDNSSTICSGTTGTNSGNRPNIRFIKNSDQVYVSATVVQPDTTFVLTGSSNNSIISVRIVTDGTLNPLTLSQLNFNTAGSANPAADITNAKVYYTGTVNTFSTGNLFGSLSSPNGAFNVTGSQQLGNGTNYFWLTYDIAPDANADNIIDAQCTQVGIGDSTYIPSVTDPAGSRTIREDSKNIVIGAGTGSNGHNWYPAPFGNWYDAVRQQYVYRASELHALGFTAGEINQLGFYVTALNGADVINGIQIKIGHTNISSFDDTFQNGLPTVFTGNYQPVIGWNMFNFSTPFVWDGSRNVVVEVCFNDPVTSANASTLMSTVGFNGTRYVIALEGQESSICSANNNWSTDTDRPNIKFIRNTNQVIVSATSVQPDTARIFAGTNNNPVIAVQVVTDGDLNPYNLTKLIFNTAGSTNPIADITTAKVYYTGLSPAFSAAALFGSLSSPNGLFEINGSQTLTNGTNYFWLTYDVPENSTPGNLLDAQCTGITISGNDYVPSEINPAGTRTIQDYFAGGVGTADNPYLVSLPKHLNNVRNYLGSNFLQTTDIDLSGYTNWVPIGTEANKFTGQYNGNSKIISSLKINGSYEDAGLFGVTLENSVLENIRLENVNVRSTVYSPYVGALVGWNRGNIYNSSSTGTVSAGLYYGTVGGLVGLNYGSIHNSFSTAAVSADGGSVEVGGFVGINSTDIYNCYSTGNVTTNGSSVSAGGFAGENTGTIQYSYSIGNVIGGGSGSVIGGFTGSTRYSYTFVSCFYDSLSSGRNDNDGRGVPKSTDSMKTLSLYTNAGWNFYGLNGGTIWNIGNGRNNGYPYLAWQYPGDVPLPVELVSFTAATERLNTTLIWKTKTEVNNYGFEIQRKAAPSSNDGGITGTPDQGTWGVAGFVKGNGNSNTEMVYEFKDMNIAPGKYLYRLKQIDNDGSFEYSDEIEVEVGTAPVEFKLSQNYPNPFNPETTIEFIIPENGKATLKIFNIIGEEVAQLFDELAEAGKYYQVRFNASSFASGIYIAKLQFGENQLIKKMTYLK